MASRRELLGGLGLAGGGLLLGLRAGAAESGAWRYHRLDPEATAALSYRIYPDGGCMYAMVRSVVGSLAEAHGEPYRSFPFDMMRYGEGGVGGWGSVCGVVNGAAALVGLFYGGQEQPEREQVIQAFGEWYQRTALPRYLPADPALPGEVAACVAGSVICHLSLGRWAAASGESVYSPAKRERCRRLTADGTAHLVEQLNQLLDPARAAAAESSAAACLACHGKGARADAFGKMDCTPCHDPGEAHP